MRSEIKEVNVKIIKKCILYLRAAYLYSYIALVLVCLVLYVLSAMETDNPQLISFLNGIRPNVSIEFQPKIDDLINYYQKK